MLEKFLIVAAILVICLLICIILKKKDKEQSIPYMIVGSIISAVFCAILIPSDISIYDNFKHFYYIDDNNETKEIEKNDIITSSENNDSNDFDKDKTSLDYYTTPDIEESKPELDAGNSSLDPKPLNVTTPTTTSIETIATTTPIKSTVTTPKSTTSIPIELTTTSEFTTTTTTPTTTATFTTTTTYINRIQVKNVIGKSYSEAFSILGSQGFIIEKKELQHSIAPVGNVVEQFPLAETYVDYGSVITLNVSTGKKQVTVILNANEGEVYSDKIVVDYEGFYTNLPIPKRDFYTFEGWYTDINGGYLVDDYTIVNNSSQHSLYAHWKENDISPWVLKSEVPFDAQIIEQKWTYEKIETKESENANEEGWNQKADYWMAIDSGTNIYAVFPTNADGVEYYNTYDEFYIKYANNDKYENKEFDNIKYEVTGEQVNSYIYYHWVYSLSGYHSEGNRIIGNYKGEAIYNKRGEFHGYANIWESFEGGYIEFNSELNAFYATGHSTYSYWWNGGIPVITQTYTKYKKIYQYTKEISMESDTEIMKSDEIVNIQEWVKYRCK